MLTSELTSKEIFDSERESASEGDTTFEDESESDDDYESEMSQSLIVTLKLKKTQKVNLMVIHILIVLQILVVLQNLVVMPLKVDLLKMVQPLKPDHKELVRYHRDLQSLTCCKCECTFLLEMFCMMSKLGHFSIDEYWTVFSEFKCAS